MGFIPDGVLTDMRTVIDDAQPDTATVARTSATVSCSVRATTGSVRIDHLPAYARQPEWLLTMPDGTDVKAGDTITVPDFGIYSALEVLNPNTDSVATDVKCVRTRDAAGALDFVANATVTVTNPNDPANAVQTRVFLYDASVDVELFPAVARYKLAVLYDPMLRDGADAIVSANWEIAWTQPNGVTQTENLSKPRYVYGPWPCAIAYFGTNN